MQRINQESKYRDVLDQPLEIQPHIVDHDFKYLTNNLLSVLKAVRDRKYVNPNSMQRITTKTSVIQHHVWFELKKSVIPQQLTDF